MVRLLLQLLLLGAMTRAELLQLSRRFVLTSRFYSKQTEVQQGMHRPGRLLPSAGPACTMSLRCMTTMLCAVRVCHPQSKTHTWHSGRVHPGHMYASSGAEGEVRSTGLSTPSGNSKSSGTQVATSSMLPNDCVTDRVAAAPAAAAATAGGCCAAASAADAAGCSGLTTRQRTADRPLVPWRVGGHRQA